MSSLRALASQGTWHISVSELATALDATVVGDETIAVTGVAQDSRLVQRGDLFAALDPSRLSSNLSAYGLGGTTSGCAYIARAIKNDCAAILLDHSSLRAVPFSLEDLGVPVLMVENAIMSLLNLGRRCASARAQQIIAVTGTAGKTTTVRAIAAALATAKQVWQSTRLRTTAVQLALDIINDRYPYYDVFIVELQSSAAHDIGVFEPLLQPTIAVITEISEAHLESLGNVDAVFREKATIQQLLAPEGLLIINDDNLYLQSFTTVQSSQRICRVGTHISAHCIGTIISHEGAFRFPTMRVALGSTSVTVSLGHLVGSHLLYPVMIALATSVECSIDPQDAASALRDLRPAPGRMSLLRGFDGAAVIDDTYNATPIAYSAALAYVGSIRRQRKVAILAGMAELGAHSDSAHRHVGRQLANVFDTVASVGPDGAVMLEEIRRQRGARCRELLYFASLSAVLEWLHTQRFGPNVVILVKASRVHQLERVVIALTAPRIIRDATG